MWWAWRKRREESEILPKLFLPFWTCLWIFPGGVSIVVIQVICQIYFLSLLGSGSGYFSPHLILFHQCSYVLRSESSEAEHQNSPRAAKGSVQHMWGLKPSGRTQTPPGAVSSTREDSPASCTAGRRDWGRGSGDQLGEWSEARLKPWKIKGKNCWEP